MGKNAHHLLLLTGFKLIILIAFTVAVLLVNTAPFLCALFLISLVGLLFSGVSKKTIYALLKASFVIIAFVVLAHVFVCDGSGTIVLVGPFGISLPGLANAYKAVLRVLTLMCSLFWLTASLSAAQILSLTQAAVSWLKASSPRLDAFGKVLSLLVLFFPLCLHQLQCIHEAQELRGSSLLKKSQSPVSVMRSFASTFVSLLVLLFQKADKRALALRSRGF